MLNSILVRARAHHADVLRQAGSCPSDPAKRQKMKQACRAAGTDCTTHPVSVCTLSLRSSGHFCSCTTVSSVRHHPCRLALQHKRGQVPQIHSAAHCAAVRGPTHPARRALNNLIDTSTNPPGARPAAHLPALTRPGEWTAQPSTIFLDAV